MCRSSLFRADVYAGRVSCCLMVSHSKYTDRTDRHTDGRTPERYITLSARHGQHNNVYNNFKSGEWEVNVCLYVGV